MYLNGLKVIHINLHHSEEVTDDLLRFMEKEDLPVLIQEQRLVSNKVCNIWSIFYRMNISLV